MESETLLTTCAEEIGDLKNRVIDESKKIWKVALPGILSRAASFGCVVVTQSFIGHLGKLELAGYALVQSLSVRFVNGILIGMSSASVDTESYYLEMWYTAVLVVLAGYMQNAEIAISAFSICLNINYWELTINLGLYGAACVRVANELGKGDAKAVKFAIKTILSISAPIGLFFWLICLIFGNKIGYLFSEEQEVADTISGLSLLLSFSVLLNTVASTHCSQARVAVGAGLQSSVAVITLSYYYLIGIPIGVLLGYQGHMQVKGIWIGMICGVVAQTSALGIMIWRTDWAMEVTKTRERLNRWYLKSSEDPNQKFDRA